MFDTHLHTKVSTDSKMNIEHAIETANKLNMGIIITDHMDLNYPEHGQFIFDVDEYFREYSKFRSDKVLIGIEMGMGEDCFIENKALEGKYDFDYVLGSIHIVNNIDIYNEIFYKNKSKEQAYNEYFDAMLKCIKQHSFVDSLGHIDYICRYAKYKDNEIYYQDFKENIDSILRSVAETEKALEINTRRLYSKEAVENLIPIYKRFKELGGKYVTIGSDGHTTEAIGVNFKVAEELANTCRLKPVYFKARKHEYIK